MYNTTVQPPFPLAAKMPNSVRDRGKASGEWREREREMDWHLINVELVIHRQRKLHIDTSLHIPRSLSLRPAGPCPVVTLTRPVHVVFQPTGSWLLFVYQRWTKQTSQKTQTLPKSSTARRLNWQENWNNFRAVKKKCVVAPFVSSSFLKINNISIHRCFLV
jgi:hypothetical protein